MNTFVWEKWGHSSIIVIFARIIQLFCQEVSQTLDLVDEFGPKIHFDRIVINVFILRFLYQQLNLSQEKIWFLMKGSPKNIILKFYSKYFQGFTNSLLTKIIPEPLLFPNPDISKLLINNIMPNRSYEITIVMNCLVGSKTRLHRHNDNI